MSVHITGSGSFIPEILKKHKDAEIDIDTSTLMTDIDEVWDMTNLPAVLAKVYQDCRFKNFKEIEL